MIFIKFGGENEKSITDSDRNSDRKRTNGNAITRERRSIENL